MFEAWGRVVYRQRRLILAIALIVVAVGDAWGTGVFSRLQSAGGFAAPNSRSAQEANLAAGPFGRDAGDVAVLYSSPALTVRSPAFGRRWTPRWPRYRAPGWPPSRRTGP